MTAGADVLKVSILGTESIHVGFHLLPYIFNTILTTLPSSTYALVTDTNLSSLYLPDIQKAFEHASKQCDSSARFITYQVAPGEGAKSRAVKAEIEDWLLENRCTRDTVILAFGGGVIGDLTGFVAATFMRGVKFVQIPTTLLAMVDSSVGGKTAIDTSHGKNLIGAFWQPSYIFVDLAFLTSLPPREIANGMAEVVKTAAIWKEDDFASLESSAEEIMTAASTKVSAPDAGRFANDRSPSQSLLLKVVTGSIHVKAHIVTVDERETGLRNLVNFGHTIGHAIEAVLTPSMLHGECVSIGMILEAEVARQLGVLSQVAVGRLTRCLQAYGLPISLSDRRITALPASNGLGVERLLDIMRIDKKNSGPAKKIVILSRIGKTFEEKATVVADEIIRKVLCDAVTIRAGTPSKSPVIMATPGSKSISNRALVLAALGKGPCRVKNLLHSDDTAVMMNALAELKGATFSWEDGGDTILVQGGEGRLSAPAKGKELYLGNAGTAARFLTTVCALVSSRHATASSHTSTVVTGNARMKQRPIGPLVEALRFNGASISYLGSEGCLPLDIDTDGFHGGHIQLAATVSSQYVSSILLCAPYASDSVTLELIGGQVISQPYIDMTIAMMAEFGITVTRQTDSSGKLLDVYVIPKGTYVNPEVYNVESDASSATYPLAIAAITGTTCTISNIGSSSLQGDARFAKEVLEPMGCLVEQTATSTTVTGPPKGQLRALGNVDMEPMTDAFLTASVLAAVAIKPLSRIYGIANQRVKECNRILAMRDQLAKFGVKTDEFDTGIIIFGQNCSTLKEGASIHCYDDHRVAMAFAVLGTLIDRTIIEEKRCVEKTWPNFWDDLSNKIGIHSDGVELVNHQASSSQSNGHVQPSDLPIFLIGMRGAGKTYIGQLAASTLLCPYIDADVVFETRTSMSVSDYVAVNGWPAFRETETEILSELSATAGKSIISLGGGVVETPEARDILKSHIKRGGNVVHVTREVKAIEAFLQELGATTGRPAYGEPFQDVYKRREPWYRQCSNYDFFNVFEPLPEQSQKDHHQAMKSECGRFFSFISGANLNRPKLGPENPTTFLSLTFPDITVALGQMDELTEGADAIELRADLLNPTGQVVNAPSIPSLEYVGRQLSLLRLVTNLPIVYSVRSKEQGGFFPSDQPDAYEETVILGLRSACEYVDMEVAWPVPVMDSIVSHRGQSHIIASWHDWSGSMKWSSHEVRNKYIECAKYGDIVKIVGTAKTSSDNSQLQLFVSSLSPNSKPLLAINMGELGQLSRITNLILTPITHPLLPSRAAPGQLSVKEILLARHLIGMLPSKKFYIAGSPISHSMSPTLHNAAFKACGYPHVYTRLEAATIDDEFLEILHSDETGGMSITMPLKLLIMDHLDSVSPDARLLGAVNTVIPSIRNGKRWLHGENTDWQAIYEAASTNLPSSSSKQTLEGLVIGAGGTCRAALMALHTSKAKRIYLYNRTLSNAEKVKSSFPKEFNIEIIDDLSIISHLDQKPQVIISTVPGESLTLKEGQGIYLSESIFGEEGVAIDLAYKPRKTALIQLAEKKGWKAVSGIEILCLQGYKQHELWMGKKAPKKKIYEGVMEVYLK
ncbi:hypothetical protein TREMEDRAFT_44120 [Tremella mesenterica DSM 1558]|uniref:uncharacterized protein n=1 Tax=Tremella mesenterica (strain ATCC 24925 / CBS 8224 / DSM 1558 / NBRC 9311 / NRRL Y-6157 / RJB 2259-6 / UBC 559-6) TaxID=578456 RepID=UPI0003F49251|nr:uncharacterized protein TREMEDRAFT_44120 [Tremella mesenterica DSM 1558]EIW69636.1 hypothetical protein TREMEDRAFT_44120 [Tremella mesenterica DSM 1558]